MTTRRYYANAAPQQTLQSQITNSALTLTINGSFAGWPTNFPFYACLEYGTASMEIVSVTAIAGATATIVRGSDGTSAISHNAGATIDQVIIRQDLDEANAHTSSNSGVHGIAGNVVGDTDAQTLTNKTLSSPTVSGTVAGSPTASGSWTFKTASTSGGFSQFVGDGTTGVALSVVPGKAGLAFRSTNVANNLVQFSVDDTGLLTAVAGGTFGPYTNEAAAGTKPAGTIVYLTAPTTASQAGLFVSLGGGTWTSMPGSVLGTANSATAFTSSGTNGVTEAMATDRQATVTVVAGRQYFVEFGGRILVSVNATTAVLGIHAAIGAVSSASPVIAGVQKTVALTGSASADDISIRQLWVPGASGTYNLQQGIKSVAGTGNSQIVGGIENAFITVTAA